MQETQRIQLINESISSLAGDNPDISAIVSIGSFSQGRFDDFSDIDLYLFTNRPEKYTNKEDISWLMCFGRIISIKVYRDYYEKVDKVRFILDHGLMYEMTIVSANRFNIIKYYMRLKKVSLDFVLPGFIRKTIKANVFRFNQTIKRGYKVHYDRIKLKETLSGQLAAFRNELPMTLKKDVFSDNYTNFWHSCYTAAVKLIRGEFYHYVLLYDHHMKYALLRMIEWDTLQKDSTADVFFNGIRIDKWAGMNVYDELLQTLPHKDVEEMQHVLLRTISLYQQFSRAVAAAYGFPLNEEFEQFVIDFIRQRAIPATNKRLTTSIA